MMITVLPVMSNGLMVCYVVMMLFLVDLDEGMRDARRSRVVAYSAGELARMDA